jgi:hypothetical protein
VTCWSAPDQDTMRRIAFQLQRPGWQITSPASRDSADRYWHATDGTTHLAAPSLGALLDELDWRHAT